MSIFFCKNNHPRVKKNLNHYSADGAQVVTVTADFRIKDTLVIQAVHSHFAGGMYDCFLPRLLMNDDPYMRDPSFRIVKESEVTGLCFIRKGNELAGFSLLVRVPRD